MQVDEDGIINYNEFQTLVFKSTLEDSDWADTHTPEAFSHQKLYKYQISKRKMKTQRAAAHTHTIVTEIDYDFHNKPP